jgi:hypothetical protein
MRVSFGRRGRAAANATAVALLSLRLLWVVRVCSIVSIVKDLFSVHDQESSLAHTG